MYTAGTPAIYNLIRQIIIPATHCRHCANLGAQLDSIVYVTTFYDTEHTS